MKRMTLAAFAAVLAASSAASAADVLPAEPIAEVGAVVTPSATACDVIGVGYLALPHTDTCLGISGHVRAAAFSDHRFDTVVSGIEARVAFDARTATEIGNSRAFIAIESKFLEDDTDVRIDEAYIELGGLRIGHSETLFNRDVLYGDAFDGELGIGNANQVRYVHNLTGGFYVAGSVEDSSRDGLTSVHIRGDRPEVVLRGGQIGAGWGSADVSFIYSGDTDHWGVKGTADLNVNEDVTVRFSSAYFDEETETAAASAAVRWGFAQSLAAYAGGTYGVTIDDRSFADYARDGSYAANIGLEYSPIDSLVFQGEVAHFGERRGDDGWGTMLRVTQGF